MKTNLKTLEGLLYTPAEELPVETLELVVEWKENFTKELQQTFDPEKHVAWFSEDILKEILGQ